MDRLRDWFWALFLIAAGTFGFVVSASAYGLPFVILVAVLLAIGDGKD